MTNPVTITAPEGLPFIDIEREFDYPVELVFRAHKDPELFTQWVGPRGYEMRLEEFDFRSGGRYRFTHTGSSGDQYAFNGVYHVVRDNDFAIQTFEFEDVPDVVSIESVRFEELPEQRCRIRVHAVYPTLEARDGMVASGQEKGVTEGYEKLDEVLGTL
jgi:uncharacterized protein YndB with AHSA1/START domain